MRPEMTLSFRCAWPVAAGFLLAGLLFSARAGAAAILLKDGRVLHGRKGETSSLAEQPGAADADALKAITFMNDDLRIVFVPRRQIVGASPDTLGDDAIKFDCEQPHDQIGKSNRSRVASVGPPAGKLEQFDEWGRRTYPMRTAAGVKNVVQVITEITPQYARVQVLELTWDMRIATSTIDDDTLEKLLMHQIYPKNVSHRKRIIKFFIQCKRYGRAVKVLQELLDSGLADTATSQELLQTKRTLRLMSAQQALDELGIRRDNGQHALVQKFLAGFPTDGMTGEILATVRQVQQQYKDFGKQRDAIEKDLGTLLTQVGERADRAVLAPALREIDAELNIETLPRMSAFLQNQNAAGMGPEEKLSLAVGGWLLGADTATPNLPLALSAWRMHRAVRDYLAEPMKVKRDHMLSRLPQGSRGQARYTRGDGGASSPALRLARPYRRLDPRLL